MPDRSIDSENDTCNKYSPVVLQGFCGITSPANFLTQRANKEKYKHWENSKCQRGRAGKGNASRQHTHISEHCNNRIYQQGAQKPDLVLYTIEIERSPQELPGCARAAIFVYKNNCCNRRCKR